MALRDLSLTKQWALGSIPRVIDNRVGLSDRILHNRMGYKITTRKEFNLLHSVDISLICSDFVQL